MQTGTKEKGVHLSMKFTCLPSYYTLKIDVAIEKYMDWFIPFPIELLIGIWVPPILIKLSAIKSRNLCKEVTHILKDQEEGKDNKGCSWEHESK